MIEDIVLMKRFNINAVRIVALSERSAAVVRPLRRVRAVRRRRGEHRIARDGIRRRVAGQEPCLGQAHLDRTQRMVERDKNHRSSSGRWATRRATGSTSQGDLRLDYSMPIPRDRSTNGWARPQHRHLSPDVHADRADARVCRQAPAAAADPMRIRPRHGQQRGKPPGLLGRHREPPAIAGGLHLGLGRSGPAGRRARGLQNRLGKSISPTGRFRRRAQRHELLLQRAGAADRAEPAFLRGRQGLPVDQQGRAGRHGRRPRPRDQQVLLPQPRPIRAADFRYDGRESASGSLGRLDVALASRRKWQSTCRLSKAKASGC